MIFQSKRWWPSTLKNWFPEEGEEYISSTKISVHRLLVYLTYTLYKYMYHWIYIYIMYACGYRTRANIVYSVLYMFINNITYIQSTKFLKNKNWLLIFSWTYTTVRFVASYIFLLHSYPKEKKKTSPRLNVDLSTSGRVTGVFDPAIRLGLDQPKVRQEAEAMFRLLQLLMVLPGIFAAKLDQKRRWWECHAPW